MGRFVIRRILWMFVVLLFVSFITFMLMHAVPGGPFDRERALPAQTIENLNRRYHLDWPLSRQYLSYLYDVFVPRLSVKPPSMSLNEQFLIEIKLGKLYFRWMNFGPSIVSPSRTVNDIFRDQLPISFQLGLMAVLFAMVLGIPLGIIAALKQNTVVDYIAMSIAILGVSVPVIVAGPILVSIFALGLKWFPPSGWGSQPPFILGVFPSQISLDYFSYAVMPVVALGAGGSALLARLTRASLLQVVREDYIRTARSKGLSERLVIVRHALRNSTNSFSRKES
ncbi:MAG: ABC transporter permease, partial [Chloroflexi bacterium]|nr:ABC transporter permease [Chloroflexota bacterium]